MKFVYICMYACIHACIKKSCLGDMILPKKKKRKKKLP